MTKMIRIPIATATDAQIRDFCDVQQVELTNTSRSGMLATLSAMWEHDHILAPGAEPGDEMDAREKVQPVAQQIVSTGLGENDPKWLVEIGETEMIGGKDPVPVGVNGRAVVLQRNMRIELPHRYKIALDLAVRETVEQDERTHEISTSRVRAYPLYIHERPSDADIAQWEKATAGIELGVNSLRAAA
jgi:hypothetical protein